MRYPRGQLHGFLEGRTGGRDITHDVLLHAFCRVEQSARQHHVGHHRGAHYALDAHGAAPTHKNAALAFGQAKKCSLVTDPQVRSAGQFQPAADHRALQRGHKRNRAALDLVKHFMPGMALALARWRGLPGGAFQGLGQIQPGAEVAAVGKQHGHVSVVMRLHHGRAQLRQQRVAHGIAFVGAVQANERDVAIEFVGHQGFVH